MKIMIKLEAEDTPAEVVKFCFCNPFIFKFELEKDYKNGCVGTTWIGIKTLYYRIKKIWIEKGESARYRIKRKQKEYKKEMKLKTQYFTEEAIEEHCPVCQRRWIVKYDFINLWATAYCQECENIKPYKMTKINPDKSFQETLDELKKSWYNFKQEIKGLLKPKGEKENVNSGNDCLDCGNSSNDRRDSDIFKFLETGKRRFEKVRFRTKAGNGRSNQKARERGRKVVKNA